MVQLLRPRDTSPSTGYPFRIRPKAVSKCSRAASGCSQAENRRSLVNSGIWRPWALISITALLCIATGLISAKTANGTDAIPPTAAPGGPSGYLCAGWMGVEWIQLSENGDRIRAAGEISGIYLSAQSPSANRKPGTMQMEFGSVRYAMTGSIDGDAISLRAKVVGESDQRGNAQRALCILHGDTAIQVWPDHQPRDVLHLTTARLFQRERIAQVLNLYRCLPSICLSQKPLVSPSVRVVNFVRT